MMRVGVLVACALWVVSVSEAADWPHWRGPYFNGSSDEEGLPVRFSATKNIAWSSELPGAAAATPIVFGERVFLSGVDVQRDMLQASCYDRKTGALRWRHDVARGIRRDERSNFAAPSPVTDGEVVVFFYSNGDLIGYDVDGTRRWGRNIQKDFGEFAFFWTFSSSPVLLNGRLYIQVLQRDEQAGGRGLADRENESYLLALDSATGKKLWRHIRPSRAKAESREAFTSPIPFRHNGAWQLLVAGGDALTGHDPTTGEELWRWGTWNPARVPHWRLVTSPVAGGGVILACAPKREPVYAVKVGGHGRLGDDALGWVSREAREVSSDVPTPAFYDGDFFVLSDLRKCLSRVEASTGKVKWTRRTPGRTKYEASPLAADGKIYIINFDGDVSVFGAADGKLLATISMDKPRTGEKVRASIAAAGGQLFIRTTRTLYCVGERRR